MLDQVGVTRRTEGRRERTASRIRDPFYVGASGRRPGGRPDLLVHPRLYSSGTSKESGFTDVPAHPDLGSHFDFEKAEAFISSSRRISMELSVSPTTGGLQETSPDSMTARSRGRRATLCE